jgi:AcrR family transcriptional regulator
MEVSSTRSSPTRERILAGAAAVIGDKGIGRTTTREIARAAGVSEGSLFNHFTDKLDLLSAVLAEAVPDLAALRATAGDGPGTGDLTAKLVATVEAATDFYLATLPLEAGVLADQALLERWRDRHTREDSGPQAAHRELGAYLRAEQHLGRLPGGTDPEVLATVLLGAAQYAAFVELITGAQALPHTRRERATATVDLVLARPRSTNSATW